MKFSADNIYYYVEDMLLNYNNNSVKAKSVKIHSIKPLNDRKFNIEFSLETYLDISNFIPDKGSWISSSMIVDTSDIKVQRDIQLANILRD